VELISFERWHPRRIKPEFKLLQGLCKGSVKAFCRIIPLQPVEGSSRDAIQKIFDVMGGFKPGKEARLIVLDR
jgi:hypothetical protein